MSTLNWTAIILGVIGLLQAIGIVVIPLMIQKGRKEVGAVGAKVDVGNAATDVVHTIVNNRTDQLVQQLAAAHAEIQRLATLLPAPKEPLP